MSSSAVSSIPGEAPSRKVAATLLGSAFALADVAVLLLILPIPGVLLLAPLLVPGDQIDLGFAQINSPVEAWLAAIPGSILVLTITVATRRVTRLQWAWVSRQTLPPRSAFIAGEPSGNDAITNLEQLTERENQVLGLMSQGLTNSAIAQELFISETTVRKHIGRVFAKLDVNTGCNDRRVTAVLAFVQHGNRT